GSRPEKRPKSRSEKRTGPEPKRPQVVKIGLPAKRRGTSGNRRERIEKPDWKGLWPGWEGWIFDKWIVRCCTDKCVIPRLKCSDEHAHPRDGSSGVNRARRVIPTLARVHERRRKPARGTRSQVGVIKL